MISFNQFYFICKRAWESLKHIRNVHVAVSSRSERNGLGIVSQKDMAITQFAFVGMQLLNPELVGIVGSRRNFESFSHFWRVLGYLMGIEDRFNVCGETLDETLSRLKAIKEELLLPNFVQLNKDVEEYLRIAVEGFKGFEPWVHADSALFTIKRFLEVPNCDYYQTQSFEGSLTKYEKLTRWSRFRITTDVFVFEYLTKVWCFRWCFNLLRICFSIFDFFPIFAIIKFGKKYAYVEVLKRKQVKVK